MTTPMPPSVPASITPPAPPLPTLGGGSLPAPYKPEAETASTAVAAREKAGVEARFLVALHRPRNPDTARLRILDACKRPRFAEGARYAKPIGEKKVFGLSVRFAEEAARAWGNMDITAHLALDDDERRIYRVTGTDLESNTTQSQDVMIEKVVERKEPRAGQVILRSRKNTKGQTVYLIEASEDDLLTKTNASLAKHRRNIILSLIPSDIQEEAEALVIETVKNRDAADPGAARKRVTDSFWTIGVEPGQLESFLGKALEQINPAELDLLRSIFSAIRDGETSWADAVDSLAARKAGTGAPHTGTAGLKATLRTSPTPAEGAPPNVPEPLPAAPLADLELDQTIQRTDARRRR